MNAHASRRRRRAFAAALIAVALLGGSDARAHGPTTSYSTSDWRLDAEAASARVVVRAAWPDLRRAIPALARRSTREIATDPVLVATLEGYLLERFALRAGGAPCLPVGGVRALPSTDASHLARAWDLRCRGGAPRELAIDSFFAAIPGHVHLARIETSDGHVLEHVFVSGRRQLRLAPGTPAVGASFGRYLTIGVAHILQGFDHLAFLLALVLTGTALRELVVLVTGFTVAHSATLALAALGWVEPSAGAVEALIGLSIVVAALESFVVTGGPVLRRRVGAGLAVGLLAAVIAAAAGYGVVPLAALLGMALFSLCYLLRVSRGPRRPGWRWLLAFGFGLVHGFGFAGLLVELGLPPGRVATSLLGFNLGVEVGQLVLVGVAWPLIRAGLRRSTREALWIQVASTFLLTLGLYWFVSRAAGAG